MTGRARRSAARWAGVVAVCWAVAAAAPAAAITAAAPAAAPGQPDLATTACGGVGVVVDFAGLGADGLRGCAPLAPGETITALEAVQGAGLSVEGTAQWGTAFLCRIDGRPSTTEEISLPDGTLVRETCTRTPSQHAYWSLWFAGADHATDVWGYATTGASDLVVRAGDVVGLVFTTGEQAAAPSVTTALARAGDLPDGWSDREPAATAPGETGPEAGPAGPGVVPLLAVGLVLVGAVGATVVARRRR